ncbi:MAG TPA: TIGR03943 family protein [Anaerolineae bacterium]|nr:TIGR03943 family protein [Anaerolineae bacterium]HRJ74515.1 TIGR03943 family protein [Anaerolineales bacterium]
MTHRMARSFQGLILLGLCIFFASKTINGQLTWYINARFIPLTLFGILFLAILAQTVFAEVRRSRAEDKEEHEHHHHEHEHSPAGLWVMLIPLLIGILIPPRPLDSSAFTSKGFNTNAPLVSAESSAQLFETESEERNILDWLKLFNYNDNVNQFSGQQASVIGFVYFDEALGENQFYVSRFVVSCCAADGFAIAMPVQWNDYASLEQDAWVQVKGTIEAIVIDDRNVPLIVAESVQEVPVPERPYLFP